MPRGVVAWEANRASPKVISPIHYPRLLVCRIPVVRWDIVAASDCFIVDTAPYKHASQPESRAIAETIGVVRWRGVGYRSGAASIEEAQGKCHRLEFLHIQSDAVFEDKVVTVASSASQSFVRLEVEITAHRNRDVVVHNKAWQEIALFIHHDPCGVFGGIETCVVPLVDN